MKLPEEFINYLWSLHLLKDPLETTDGQVVRIHSAGIRNEDSGPDFFNARIKIGDTEWAGNVEIHSSSSDWIKHNHHIDKLYDSVILHVVYEDDIPIYNSHGELIPTVVIKGKFQVSLFFRYKKLVASRDWVPCEKNLFEVPDLVIYNWLDRILVDRLERKSDFIFSILDDTNNNWEEAFYILLSRSFGFNTNSQPFEMLARSLPLSVINKHKDNLFQIEALLFGQSGLLNPKLNDDYNKLLLAEYDFLSKKYNLEHVKSWTWKFMRMRPVNFPTIRIAQFAKLINNSGHLLSKVLETSKLGNLKSLFLIEADQYWLNHYTFGKESKVKTKSFGSDAFDLILINTIIPFLFVYGRRQGDEILNERALMFLQQTKAEHNGIVKRWSASGIKAQNAAQSQALLTLKNDYCTYIKCLNCAIGAAIMKPELNS